MNLNGLTRFGDSLANPKVGIEIPDSVIVGDELVATIFLEDEGFDLISAYVDCKDLTKAIVDTVSHPTGGGLAEWCEMELMVQNDTLYIGFRPTQPGIKPLQEITLLTR